MAIGPVQLVVLGFRHPEFHGEIIAELERLRVSDTVRVIDALAVYKHADGEVEVEHLSNLTQDTSPALVHFADGSTQQWLLVRLNQPKEGGAAAPPQ